jgi:hypothetical protein
MSDPRKVMQGRQVSSSLASQQFRGGNNAAINGFSASARTEKASHENLSKALHSEARAYERSGWQQEKLYQTSKKNKLFGNN